MWEKQKKAMYLLYKRLYNLQIPTDLQIQLFKHTILPILLYGCEIWGFRNSQLIENVQNQFIRTITHLRKSTRIYMIYAELGIAPVEMHIKSRMIGFWIALINSENTKLYKIMYKIMLNESNQGSNFKWISTIKETLISVGKPELFNKNIIDNPKAVKENITKTLHDFFFQNGMLKYLNLQKGENTISLRKTQNLKVI